MGIGMFGESSCMLVVAHRRPATCSLTGLPVLYLCAAEDSWTTKPETIATWSVPVSVILLLLILSSSSSISSLRRRRLRHHYYHYRSGTRPVRMAGVCTPKCRRRNNHCGWHAERNALFFFIFFSTHPSSNLYTAILYYYYKSCQFLTATTTTTTTTTTTLGDRNILRVILL